MMRTAELEKRNQNLTAALGKISTRRALETPARLGEIASIAILDDLRGGRDGESEGRAMTTKIEWCDETWNPVTGCSWRSVGCDNCYARRMANRLRGRFGYPADDPFRVTFHLDRLDQPLHWRKARRIFVCSMGDLFHDDVGISPVKAIVGVQSDAPQHTYLWLTKRPSNMEEIIFRLFDDNPAPNLWLGVTVEHSDYLRRFDYLCAIPATVRWVSLEPLLGPVDLHSHLPYIQWVVVGPETGPGARPMNLDWARLVRNQCADAGVAFFYKAGELDGRLHHEFPVEARL